MSEIDPKKRIGGRRIGTHDMATIRAIVAAKKKAAEAEAEAKAATTTTADPANKQQQSPMMIPSDKPTKSIADPSEPVKRITPKLIDVHYSAIATTGSTQDQYDPHQISDVTENTDSTAQQQTLLGTGNAISDQTCPHRHVKLRMTYKERLKYVPPRGINVLFYGPRNDELRLPDDEVHATFYCPILNPNRDEQRYIDDIDEELAANLKVIQDNIQEWHEPKLIKKPKVLIHTLIEKIQDHPDLDHAIKNMRDLTTTDVTESAIEEINTKTENMKQYEKLKQNLLKKTERKTADGDKISEGTIGVL